MQTVIEGCSSFRAKNKQNNFSQNIEFDVNQNEDPPSSQENKSLIYLEHVLSTSQFQIFAPLQTTDF